ncbi:MAG: hypothetical protein RLZZ469_1405 [Bacteroidota bacterium]
MSGFFYFLVAQICPQLLNRMIFFVRSYSKNGKNVNYCVRLVANIFKNHFPFLIFA